MKTYTLTRDHTPIAHYDVVVLGGGPAGWVAAVSAARQGCRTALVERYGFFGGTATAGIVVPMSGFALRGRRVVGGIATEFAQKMVDCGAALFEHPSGHLSYDPETYKLFAARMIREAGVAIYMNSYLSGCFAENGRVDAVLIDNKNGTELLEGDLFIDATGDADLFFLAGLPMLPPRKLQPVSLCFILGGVDTTTPLLRDCIHHNGKNQHGSSACQPLHALFSELFEKGEAPLSCGPWFNALLTGDHLAVNATRAAVDATDNRAFSETELRLREDMFRLLEILRARVPEFKNAYIASSATQTGVRETRHIKGVHTLTIEEFLAGEVSDETVALAAHPIDIHLPGSTGQVLKSLQRPGPIPYGAMISPESPNLIAAGRSISCDSESYASLRVQATMMALGEAAGVAAALAHKGGGDVRQVDRRALHSHLDLPPQER